MITATKKAKKLKRPAGDPTVANGESLSAPGRGNKTGDRAVAKSDGPCARQASEVMSATNGVYNCAGRKSKRGDSRPAKGECKRATRAGAILQLPKGESLDSPAQTNGAANSFVPNGEITAAAPKSKRGKSMRASNGETVRATPGGEDASANGAHHRAPKNKRAAGERLVARSESRRASRAASNGRAGEVTIAKSENECAGLCQQIMALYRVRNFHMDLRKQMENACGSMLRMHLGYRANMPEEESEPIKDVVSGLLKKLDTSKPLTAQESDLLEKAEASVTYYTMMSTPIVKKENDIKKQLESLAKMLHIAGWVEGVKGLGFLTVANIIGETGDLWNYSTIDKVWKRMGMAPIKGKMPSSWRMHSKEKLSAEEWTEAGYCPRRRSVMWNAAAAFVKQIKKDDEGNIISTTPYREYYDAVKVKSAEVHPDWTPAHVNNHALLLVGKRLLRDLYRAWRGEQQ